MLPEQEAQAAERKHLLWQIPTNLALSEFTVLIAPRFEDSLTTLDGDQESTTKLAILLPLRKRCNTVAALCFLEYFGIGSHNHT